MSNDMPVSQKERLSKRAARFSEGGLVGVLAPLVTLDGAGDGGAADGEQVGELAGAVLTGGVQIDEMSFLARVEHAPRSSSPSAF
jgi:hypothetical protein